MNKKEKRIIQYQVKNYRKHCMYLLPQHGKSINLKIIFMLPHGSTYSICCRKIVFCVLTQPPFLVWQLQNIAWSDVGRIMENNVIDNGSYVPFKATTRTTLTVATVTVIIKKWQWQWKLLRIYWKTLYSLTNSII